MKKEYTVMGHKTRINPTGLFAGICGIIIGLILAIFPESTISIILYAIGAICIVIGLITLLRFFKMGMEEATASNGFMMSLVWCMGGLLVILYKDFFITLFPLIVGFLILVGGFYKLQGALIIRRFTHRSCLPALIPALISVAAGLLIVFFPFSSTMILMRLIGIFIIYECACDLLFRKKMKKNAVPPQQPQA